jgi:hypothetical protein
MNNVIDDPAASSVDVAKNGRAAGAESLSTAGRISSPRILRRKKRSWLLVTNCQGIGLGNCISLLSPDVAIEHYTPTLEEGQAVSIASRVDDFDRILITPAVDPDLQEILKNRENTWILPSFFFYGYHPDLCNILENDRLVTGPLGGFQSFIARAAFLCGLSEQQTLALYREEIYERLGYFSCWVQAREDLINRYAVRGFEIRREVLIWSRGGPFMHTPTHPRIECLRGLAEVIIRRAGLELNDTNIVPHDNLANGPVFPVYPEIGSFLGVRGGYIFKFGGGYQCMTLADFIDRSFEIYRSRQNLSVSLPFQSQLERTIAMIGAGQ